MNEPRLPYAKRRGDNEPVQRPFEHLAVVVVASPGLHGRWISLTTTSPKTVRVSPSLAQDIKMAAALEKVTETELIITLISPGIQEIKRKHLEGLLEDLGDWNLEITFNI